MSKIEDGSLLNFSGRRKLPMIFQAEQTECGFACMSMILAYFGRKYDLNTLRNRHHSSNRGNSLADLIKIAKSDGLMGRPLRLELSSLGELKVPCILHWNLNHFVVLKKVSGKKVTIHDPARGIQTLSLVEVSKSFTGIALELTPTQDFKKADFTNKFRPFRLFANVVGIKRSMAVLLSMSFALQIMNMILPYYSQLVFDEVIVSADLDLLSILALGFGFLVLLRTVTNALRDLLLLRLGTTLSAQFGANIFNHLIYLPVSYFKSRHLGDIMSRFGSLENIKDALTKGVIAAIIDGVMVLGTIAILFLYSWQLALIVLAIAGIYSFLRYLLFNPLRGALEESFVHQGLEQSSFMESLRGITPIKLFGKENERLSLWRNLYVDFLNSGIKIRNIQITYISMQNMLFDMSRIITLFIAAKLVFSNQFSVGMIVAFLAYQQNFLDRFSSLIDNFVDFKMLKLHFDRLSDMIDEKSEQSNDFQHKNIDIKGNISVNDLHYRYSEKDPEVLNGISLDICSGESVAIVGASGSGKTTLLNLMLGLMRPTKGQIYIDDIVLEPNIYQSYRSHVAAVMQDDKLLSGSIAENIAFFDSKIDYQRVQECCELAFVAKDIEQFPMGYLSNIGDMGTALSGGQIQRILLARALYRNPKILFMDEATSNLDIELEKKISHSIKDLKITRVIIAHRPETINSVDRIIDITKHECYPAQCIGN